MNELLPPSVLLLVLCEFAFFFCVISGCFCGFQDILGVKAFKKSQFVMRTLLIFAFVFGAYICFVCLKLLSPHANPSYNVEKVQVFRRRYCNVLGFDPRDRAYLHYPKPKTFSRFAQLVNFMF